MEEPRNIGDLAGRKQIVTGNRVHCRREPMLRAALEIALPNIVGSIRRDRDCVSLVCRGGRRSGEPAQGDEN